MKNRITLFAVLTALVLSLTAFVQLSKKEMATGKWQMTNLEISPNPMEAFVSQLPKEQQAMFWEKWDAEIKESCKVSHLSLNADGTYELVLKTGKEVSEETGTWSINSDGKSITFIEEGTEEEDVLEVRELSSDSLTLAMSEEGEGNEMTIIMEFAK